VRRKEPAARALGRARRALIGRRTLGLLIELHTLTDGGQSALDVARKLAGFLEPATHTIELALYDVRLQDETGEVVRDALLGAHDRGVQVRLVYNLDRPDRVPIPPPPKTEPELLESLPFATVGIKGWPDLMHHKFVIRDGTAVWTGSTNWTDDSWTREENVIAIVESEGVAERFGQDFEQLWKTRDVQRSGKVDSSPVAVDGRPVRAWFSPKRGEKLAQEIARRIGTAERRVRIASPVITSGPILGTLAEVAADGNVDLTGVVDATQIFEVLAQWRENGNATWKTPSLGFVLERGRFTGKHSTPYAPGAVHDYMHAKLTVCDDVVFVGSFNLSHSGEQNAENVLEIEDAELADRMAAYVDDVRAKYEPMRL
jgi:phosphatidylserine/phosphatidylglycerophosphate/cardiolipin synthase-like enzyme